MREIYLYEKVSAIFESIDFTERKVELMYQAAKERLDFDNGYSERVLQTLQTELESLKTKESLLLDTFLAEQITKELYDSKMLALHNERVSINKQIKEARAKQPECMLEPTKKVFLEASRAKKEFLAGDDFKKRNILENLCWNLSVKEKNIYAVCLKSPYDIMFKAPKNGNISMLLRAARELRTVILNGWHSYEMDAAVKMLRHESPFDMID